MAEAGSQSIRLRSLTDLEGDDWGEPPEDASGLMRTVFRLRHVPVGDLGPGDLRVLIGQRVGVRFVLQFALDVLEQEPFVEDYFPGDLLSTVIALGPNAEDATDNQREAVGRLVGELEPTMKFLNEAIYAFQTAEANEESTRGADRRP